MLFFLVLVDKFSHFTHLVAKFSSITVIIVLKTTLMHFHKTSMLMKQVIIVISFLIKETNDAHEAGDYCFRKHFHDQKWIIFQEI